MDAEELSDAEEPPKAEKEAEPHVEELSDAEEPPKAKQKNWDDKCDVQRVCRCLAI